MSKHRFFYLRRAGLLECYQSFESTLDDFAIFLNFKSHKLKPTIQEFELDFKKGTEDGWGFYLCDDVCSVMESSIRRHLSEKEDSFEVHYPKNFKKVLLKLFWRWKKGQEL